MHSWRVLILPFDEQLANPPANGVKVSWVLEYFPGGIDSETLRLHWSLPCSRH